ncbi:hypothetical protein POTOM_046427 [Populus tomentosa]|uniref:TF-B3 domain-containing protein n=1 Tax=Populus tomentosa TaxID=118781 RepID=A0A8X7YGS4_POPTO|nr:hypothetical protein POTOM_046427 [Populus tomentosa]
MAIFSKLLTKTDIGTRLSVPTKSLESLPCFGRGHAIDFHVQDAQSGEVWNFRCVIRKKSHPKPALCKNWRKFVSSKRLSVGDKIIFSTLAEDQARTGGAQYKIEVKRQTKIFGVSLKSRGGVYLSSSLICLFILSVMFIFVSGLSMDMISS